MLFAPKAGPETREYLSSKANEGTDYVLKQGQQLKDSAIDLLERGKNLVTSQKDQMASSVENAGQHAQVKSGNTNRSSRSSPGLQTTTRGAP
jgi:gas vesicle protein